MKQRDVYVDVARNMYAFNCFIHTEVFGIIGSNFLILLFLCFFMSVFYDRLEGSMQEWLAWDLQRLIKSAVI